MFSYCRYSQAKYMFILRNYHILSIFAPLKGTNMIKILKFCFQLIILSVGAESNSKLEFKAGFKKLMPV